MGVSENGNIPNLKLREEDQKKTRIETTGTPVAASREDGRFSVRSLSCFMTASADPEKTKRGARSPKSADHVIPK